MPQEGFCRCFFLVKPTAFIKTNTFPSLFLHNLVPEIFNPERRVGFIFPLQSWVIPQGIFELFLGNAAGIGTHMENSPSGALQSRAALGSADLGIGPACPERECLPGGELVGLSLLPPWGIVFSTSS